MSVLKILALMLVFIGNNEASDSEKEDTNLLIQRCMQEIEFLKATVTTQQETIEKLEFKMRNMENTRMNYDDRKTYYTAHRSASVTSSANQTEQKKRQTPSIDVAESPVAFYAQMSVGEPRPSSHHTIVFDNVKTDTSKSYNRFSGIFTVPLEGIYIFSTTVYAHGYLSIDIVVNNEAVSTLYPDAGSTGMWISATGTAVVNVNAGDVVFVRTRSDYRPVGEIVSQKNMAVPSFSGWLLY